MLIICNTNSSHKPIFPVLINRKTRSETGNKILEIVIIHPVKKGESILNMRPKVHRTLTRLYGLHIENGFIYIVKLIGHHKCTNYFNSSNKTC